MARVTVRMYATVREVAGTSELAIDVESMDELVRELGARYGKPMRAMLDDFPDDPEGVVVLLNGRNMMKRSARTAKLCEGDEVSIFPPVSGG
jgi:molybdopterin synthase sulfur carrier subunit